ncbi:unannotated protein [freshwater metagenome]|uniref:Unannotated protein n=1 Tax=freshwater metagenome TaxID=449393 RepID=A0A6J7EAH8_9ZZZZ|nr:YggS family pyridoxal phosphate-dependent enzyme [Actinomycetota bacterium]
MNERLELLSSSLASVQKRVEEAATSVGRSTGEITLIAVTKTYPVSDVQILASLGLTHFGENRDSEGAEKASIVSGTWHFQGQIQSKKLKSIASWASVIHSIDNLEHLAKLSKVLESSEKVMNVFIQLSLDGDPSRGGVVASSLAPLAEFVLHSSNLNLMGLMCVPPVEEDIESAFETIGLVHQGFIRDFPEAIFISAGMSSDFETAITYGATHIRVGSQILGQRAYPQ